MKRKLPSSPLSSVVASDLSEPAVSFGSRVISREHIAERAYELWMVAGCPHGRAEDFWLAAEGELRAAHTHPAPAPLTNGPAPDETFTAKVNERLNDFGDSGARSATSVSLTR